MSSQKQDMLIYSPGTQIVSLTPVRGTDGKPIHPRGAVGIIIQSPGDLWHGYRVRFLDGFEGNFSRDQICLLAEFQREAPGVGAKGDLYQNVIYRCVVGSRAYGLDDEESDTDRRGIYLPPADRQWSLYGVPEQLENAESEEVYWEAKKFVVMALKANPNVLECLYTPLVEVALPLAVELLEMREKFLSRMVYQTYNGYVASQFKKLQADLRNKGQVKWKHVMHLLRLLLAGVETLKSGVVPVHVGEHREKFLAIKRGDVEFAECEAWRLELHREFDSAVESSPLPERPDYAAGNAWLVKARRSVV